jgi:hypothetical protein
LYKHSKHSNQPVIHSDHSKHSNQYVRLKTTRNQSYFLFGILQTLKSVIFPFWNIPNTQINTNQPKTLKSTHVPLQTLKYTHISFSGYSKHSNSSVINSKHSNTLVINFKYSNQSILSINTQINHISHVRTSKHSNQLQTLKYTQIHLYSLFRILQTLKYTHIIFFLFFHVNRFVLCQTLCMYFREISVPILSTNRSTNPDSNAHARYAGRV